MSDSISRKGAGLTIINPIKLFNSKLASSFDYPDEHCLHRLLIPLAIL